MYSTCNVIKQFHKDHVHYRDQINVHLFNKDV